MATVPRYQTCSLFTVNKEGASGLPKKRLKKKRERKEKGEGLRQAFTEMAMSQLSTCSLFPVNRGGINRRKK